MNTNDSFTSSSNKVEIKQKKKEKIIVQINWNEQQMSREKTIYTENFIITHI